MNASGADWGGGYVTDIAYLPGYYHHQSPPHLNLACLLGGVSGLAITPESSLSYLELGCGCGFGALALAASNPNWQVTGIDFSPAHIAAARELAADAGIANARGTAMADIALAWLLAKPGVTAPIIGATKLDHLEAAVRAVEIELTVEEMAELEKPYTPKAVAF